MKKILIAILLLAGCGAGDGDETTINFATGEGSAGDPIIDSNCASGDSDCSETDSSVSN